MLDEAEAAFEADDYLTQDEVFHRDKKVVALSYSYNCSEIPNSSNLCNFYTR